ncbi:GTP cyclohydrolase II [Actinokineospora sp. 24-640]
MGGETGGLLPVERVADAVPSLRRVVRIPVRAGNQGSWVGADVVTFSGLADGLEHLALVFRGWQGTPLVRMHSECLTGDVFGSARCDCGPQLHEAVQVVRDGGVILYLRQEGRGIGLYNKLDAYLLQDTGMDTFTANRELNFADDARDYTSAAQMLSALDISAVRLLSNNPDKAEQLRRNGVEVVELVPTGVYLNENNHRYLRAKVEMAGHQIMNVEELP